MNFRPALTCAAIVAAVLTTAGCAVSRDQEIGDAYVDDATISGLVRSRILDHPSVSWTNFSVETLNGTVMLSGFAKNTVEKQTAEHIARDVYGVKMVNNQIEVRP